MGRKALDQTKKNKRYTFLKYDAFLSGRFVFTFANNGYPDEMLYNASLHCSPKYLLAGTVKPVLSGHSKIDKTKILLTKSSLMKVESIAECSHSAIVLTCIKQQFDLKTIFGLPFEWQLKTGFTVS